jgi:hypothetical protein
MLIFLSEILSHYSENHMKHINTLCEISAETFNIKMMVYIVTIIHGMIKNGGFNNMCIIARLHGPVSNI